MRVADQSNQWDRSYLLAILLQIMCATDNLRWGTYGLHSECFLGQASAGGRKASGILSVAHCSCAVDGAVVGCLHVNNLNRNAYGFLSDKVVADLVFIEFQTDLNR